MGQLKGELTESAEPFQVVSHFKKPASPCAEFTEKQAFMKDCTKLRNMLQESQLVTCPELSESW